eukprot:6524265-Pyramimonas_sp.AAC.1
MPTLSPDARSSPAGVNSSSTITSATQSRRPSSLNLPTFTAADLSQLRLARARHWREEKGNNPHWRRHRRRSFMRTAT